MALGTGPLGLGWLAATCRPRRFENRWRGQDKKKGAHFDPPFTSIRCRICSSHVELLRFSQAHRVPHRGGAMKAPVAAAAASATICSLNWVAFTSSALPSHETAGTTDREEAL